MIVFTIGLVFFLEVCMFIHISRKVEFYNPALFFVALPMFYANSLFLDYLISNQGHLKLRSMTPEVFVYDFNYLAIVLLTFFYIFGVYLTTLTQSGGFRKLVDLKTSQIMEYENRNSYSLLKVMFVVGSLIYILVLIGQIYGMSRGEIKALSGPVRVILSQSVFIFLCFSLMYKWRIKSLNVIILIILVFYSLVSFERENILLVIFSLVINRFPVKLSTSHIFLGLFVFTSMIYYKTVVGAFLLYVNGGDFDLIVNNISISSIRLTHTDPAASLIMLSDFLDDGSNYLNYYGSYVINPFMQILRMFTDVEWMSLGEFSTEYYTQGTMGTAFSMIIESMLNFWYFGPFIIGAVVTYVFFKTERFSGIYYKLNYFIWFIFMLKFVRTELAVVLKLYILPAMIAYVVFVWISKRQRLIDKEC